MDIFISNFDKLSKISLLNFPVIAVKKIIPLKAITMKIKFYVRYWVTNTYCHSDILT